MLIDLHTHSLFSDGELIPSELVRRLETLGYAAVAITDHSDSSTIDFVIPRVVQVSEDLNRSQSVKVIPGIELTHIPPEMIGSLVERARALGAKLVVIHGETIVEPVAPGTNRAAIEAGADLLAHPGLILPDDVRMAVDQDIFLEISGRKGHSFTNGHVARLAGEFGAKLVLNSDAHAPGDLLTEKLSHGIVEGAGLPRGSLDDLLKNAKQLLTRVGYPL